jgi:hypothetical protein
MSVSPGPAPPAAVTVGVALVAAPPSSAARRENVAPDDLSIQDIEAMLDERPPEQKPAALGSTAIMNDDELRKLVNQIDGGLDDAILPGWARPVPGSSDDIRAAVDSVDALACEIRDKLYETSEDVKVVQTDMAENNGYIQAQLVALTKEVQELRTFMHSTNSLLISVLAHLRHQQAAPAAVATTPSPASLPVTAPAAISSTVA